MLAHARQYPLPASLVGYCHIRIRCRYGTKTSDAAVVAFPLNPPTAPDGPNAADGFRVVCLHRMVVHSGLIGSKRGLSGGVESLNPSGTSSVKSGARALFPIS